MKKLLLIAALLTLNVSADLPVMSDQTRWLGYFAGWEEKHYDWGFGDDGKVIMHHVLKGEPMNHKDFVVSVLVREEVNGKWVTRQLLDEGGLESKDEPALNSKKPITLTMAFTGGTKVEVVQAMSRKRMVLMPKLVAKETENPIQIVVQCKMPDFYKNVRDKDEDEMEDLVKKDYFVGRRKKDGKKVKVKLSQKSVDLNSDKYFADGAISVEYASEKIDGKSFSAELGGKDVGYFTVKLGSRVYNGGLFEWITDMNKLGQKDSFISIAIE